MTPDELRALADDAGGKPTYAEAVVIAENKLRDMAPDLARLCAELGEALEASDALIRFLRPDLSHTRPRANSVVARNRTTLAKLSELEAR